MNDKERLKAKEEAIQIAMRRDKSDPYMDEDAFMEDVREMADEIYWDKAEREERNRYGW